MRPLSTLIEILTRDPPTQAEQAALANLNRTLERPITRGIVVIDHHPVGFLHACYWDNDNEPCPRQAVPDGYKSARRGQSIDEFREECARKWPNAEVRCVVEN